MDKAIKKLLKTFSLALCLVFSFILLFSCSNEIPKTGNEQTTSIIDLLDKDFGTKEATKKSLVEFAVFGDYELTEDEAEKEIISFLSSFNNNSNPDYLISKVHSFPVSSEENLNLDIYDVTETYLKNKTENNTFFVVIPNDRRLGNVMFKSDNISWESLVDSEDGSYEFFVQCFLNNFIRAAKNKLEIYNNITEEEIKEEKQALNLNTGLKKGPFEIDGVTVYTDWEQRGSTEPLETLKWGQSDIYNDAIQRVKHNNYLAGCGPIAISLICAYNRWPENFIQYTENNRQASLEILNRSWPGYNWTGKYNWDEINNGTNRFQIAALIFDIAEIAHADYHTDATGIFASDIKRTLDILGFSYKKINKYSEYVPSKMQAKNEEIISSIENNRPVLVAGGGNRGGHAFLIDGALLITRQKIYKHYEIDKKVTSTIISSTEVQDFMYHTNLGWYGRVDDFFDPYNISEDDSFSIVSLEVWTDIHIE